MLKLLAATTNPHKIKEFQKMLGDMENRVEIVSASSIRGIPEVVEDGTTFEENAVKKVLSASAYADMAAFADDSGLEIEALDGRPGVYSARYAGEGATQAQMMEKVLKEMGGTVHRKARFVCALALAYRGSLVATFRGEVAGTIATEPRGANGFGYDPIFIPDGFDQTFGELPDETKERISHRARAFAQAADFVRRELATMDDFEFE